MNDNVELSSDGTPETILDLEGCTDQGHCHGKRSLRQEDVINHLNDYGTRLVCHKPSGWGTQHKGTGPCRLHGGNLPGVAAKAARQAAEQTSKLLGEPIDIGPSEALLEELKQTAGTVAWLRGIVQGLEREDLVWGMVEELVEPEIRDLDNQTILSNMSGKYKALPSVWYQLLMAERQHLVNVAAKAIAAGVSERIVQTYENVHGQVAEVYMGLLERVLLRLDLTAEQRARVPAAVVAEVKMIQGSVISDE